jgi:dTMP kinase
MTGLFISFEGSDGSGKSTHIRLLSEQLIAMGYRVKVTREPGGCPIAEQIRGIVLDNANAEMTPVAEALLYAAARAQHVGEVIRPALERGEIVITDRFVDSSVAYQGYGRGLGEEVIGAINAPATGGLTPDITFFMAVDTGEAARRISDREQDRLELAGQEFHQKVYQAFRLIAEGNPQRVITVDATQSKPAVHERIMSAVVQRLNALGAPGRRD